MSWNPLVQWVVLVGKVSRVGQECRSWGCARLKPSRWASNGMRAATLCVHQHCASSAGAVVDNPSALVLSSGLVVSPLLGTATCFTADWCHMWSILAESPFRCQQRKCGYGTDICVASLMISSRDIPTFTSGPALPVSKEPCHLCRCCRAQLKYSRLGSVDIPWTSKQRGGTCTADVPLVVRPLPNYSPCDHRALQWPWWRRLGLKQPYDIFLQNHAQTKVLDREAGVIQLGRTKHEYAMHQLLATGKGWRAWGEFLPKDLVKAKLLLTRVFKVLRQLQLLPAHKACPPHLGKAMKIIFGLLPFKQTEIPYGFLSILAQSERRGSHSKADAYLWILSWILHWPCVASGTLYNGEVHRPQSTCSHCYAHSAIKVHP